MLSKEQLLAPRPRALEPVDAEELGGSVFVRALSARELIGLEQAMSSLEGIAEKMAAQLAVFVADEQGNALLSQEEAIAVIDQPGAKDAVKRIITAGLALNGYGDLRGN